MSKYLRSYFGKRLQSKQDHHTGLEIFYRLLVLVCFLYFLIASLAGCKTQEKALGDIVTYDAKWPTLLPGYCNRFYPCKAADPVTSIDSNTTTETDTGSRGTDFSKIPIDTDTSELSNRVIMSWDTYKHLLKLADQLVIQRTLTTRTITITKTVLDTRQADYYKAVNDSLKKALITAASDNKVLQSKITAKNKWITGESIALGLIVILAIAGMVLKIKL